MPSFDQIRRNVLTVIEDDGERKLCLSLIDEIEKHIAPPRGTWTYQSLSKWIGVKATDPIFQDCVNLLVTSPSAKALELHFLFFDPAVPDDPGTPLTEEQTAQAFGEGVFIHPDKGEPVPNFKRQLVPYFTPAPGLLPEGAR